MITSRDNGIKTFGHVSVSAADGRRKTIGDMVELPASNDSGTGGHDDIAKTTGNDPIIRRIHKIMRAAADGSGQGVGDNVLLAAADRGKLAARKVKLTATDGRIP